MNIFILFSIFAFLGALFLCLFVFLKGQSPKRNAFILIAFLAGSWCLFPTVASLSSSYNITLFLVKFVYIAALFTGPAFLAFGLRIAEVEKQKFEKKLIFVSYIIGILFLPILFSPLLIKDVLKYKPYFALIPGPLFPIFIVFFASACLYSFYRLLIIFKRSVGQRKNQIKYIFIAYFLAFLSAVMHFGSAYGLKEIFPHDIFVIACMALLTYAIVNYRLMDIKIFYRNILFSIIYLPILALPFAIVFICKDFIEKSFGTNWWLIPPLFEVILAPSLLYIYLNNKERYERKSQQAINEIYEDLRHIKTIDELSATIATKTYKTVGIDYSAIYLLGDDGYILKAREGNVNNGIFIANSVNKDNRLMTYFLKNAEPIILEEVQAKVRDMNSRDLKYIEDQMTSINASVAIPIFYKDDLLGFIVFGDKRSKAPYTNNDIKAYKDLASYMAFAIKNAQFYEKSSKEIADKSERKGVEHTSVGAAHQMKNILAKVKINAESVYAKIKYSDPNNITLEKAKSFISFSKECMEKILKQTDKGTETLDAILYPAQAKENFADLDIPALIKQALISSSQIKSKDILEHNIPAPILTNSVPADFPHIVGNEKLIEQIFENLINNAFDAILWRYIYLPPDSSYRGEITITAKDKGETISISIEDNGIGMKDDVKEKLFAGFFTTKSVGGKGTGAGLYSMKDWIEQHKGNISFTSEYGKGTTFTVELPKKQEGFNGSKNTNT